LAAVFGVAFSVAAFGAALAVVFAAGASFMPASLAILDRLLLRLAAVFFFRRPFLTAVSISFWAALRPAADGLVMNALTAFLMSRLITMLRSRRLTVCLARLIADLMIGIYSSLLLFMKYIQSMVNYNVKTQKSKDMNL
jgi:hypothetical protein